MSGDVSCSAASRADRTSDREPYGSAARDCDLSAAVPRVCRGCRTRPYCELSGRADRVRRGVAAEPSCTHSCPNAMQRRLSAAVHRLYGWRIGELYAVLATMFEYLSVARI